MQKSEETYFYNWIPGKGEPTVQFRSKEDAEREAMRLCLQTGERVFTLGVVSKTEPAPKTIKTVYEYLPF